MTVIIVRVPSVVVRRRACYVVPITDWRALCFLLFSQNWTLSKLWALNPKALKFIKIVGAETQSYDACQNCVR